MARGYLVRLGDGALGAGDAIVGPTIGFQPSTTLGTGSWTWSGVDSEGTTQTNFTDTGTYFLADNGNVYFVPDTLIADDLTTATATTAPTFNPNSFGTAAGETIVSGGADDVVYGGPDDTGIGTGADTFDTGAGQDVVYAGDGDDVIDGGGDGDLLYGGTGSDQIYGDGQNTPLTSNETLQWDLEGLAGTDVSAGFTQDTGDMTVMVDINNDGNQTSAEISEDFQFTGFGGGSLDPFSSLRLTGNNAGTNDPTGAAFIPTSTVSLVFNAKAGTSLANEVSNISFYINDVDAGVDGWIDQITVNAYDADGNPVPVTIIPGFLSDTVSGQTVTAGQNEDTPDSPSGAAQVTIAGPAHYVEIIYQNLSEGAQDIWLTDVEFTTTAATPGGDTLFGEAGDDSLYGGIGDDTLYGGADDDQLFGGSNDDSIAGGDGLDTAYGGTGSDTVDLGAGNDEGFGGDGNDTIEAGSGDDTLFGEDGNDTLTASSGTNILYGGTGDDDLTGGSDTDSLYGDAGNDSLRGEGGSDTLFGGAGDDDMRGGDGDDRLTASAGNDTLYGDAGNDRIYGQNDDDTLFGGAGEDTVDGGTGNDELSGGADNDSLDGDFGNDTLFGGTGEDVLNGAAGDDTAFGGAGNDTFINDSGADQLHGDAGDDTFFGLTGNDTAFGGDGSDIFIVTGSDTGTAIFGGEDLEGGDTDTLRTDAGAAATVIFNGAESGTYEDTGSGQITTFDGIERIETGGFGDTINATGAGSGIDVATAAGSDSITASAFSDTIDAGDGDDSVDGAGGADAILAGAGNDTVDGGTGADSISGGAGNDAIIGGDGADTLFGDDGDDTLTGGGGDDTLYGGTGNDTFRIDPDDGDDLIVGGENIDDTDTLEFFDSGLIQATNVTLTGDEAGTYDFETDPGLGSFSQIEAISTASGDDTIDASLGTTAMTLNAGAGDDSITGTSANDTITGGLGADTIDGGLGNDTIDLGNSGVNDNDTDLLIIRDGDGDDLITNFRLPTDNGNGTYTGNDLLDVTRTKNFDGSQVDVADVTIFADINGDAVISFPQGVTLTFAGITPAQIDNPAILAAMGFPVQDQIVEGTAGDDIIDVNYIDDPEGDLVDNNDALDSSNDDLVLGLGGNDTAYGGAGNDTVYGGDGDDSVIGEEGDDTLFGDAGSDFLNGVIGNDTLYGGAGDDFLESGTGDDTAYGGDGNDSLNGDEGDDTVFGGAGNDYVRGSFGNDTVYGGEGDDYVWGGYGDDLHIVENTFGNDTYFGDSEDEILGDTLDLSAVTDDLTIDLRNGVGEIGSFTDGTSTATFSEIEHIVLGSGTDTLQLGDNSGADRVIGFQAPTLNGDGSYTPGDLLDVSELTRDFGFTPVSVADVTLSDDGSGNVVLSFPGGESITLVGVAPADISSPLALGAMGIPIIDGVVDGTAGADLIDAAYTGDPEGDRIDSNDAILASEVGDDDIVQAGDGDDTVYSGRGDDEVQGEDGNDTLDGGSGDDILFGQSGSDSITGGSGSDSLFGGIGNDILDGDSTGTAGDTLIYMNFEDGANGTATDASGNGNDGIYQGNAAASGGGWTGVPGDTSAVLDGLGDYIEIPNDASFEVPEGTLSIRFNADTLPNGTLISRDSSDFDGGGHFRLEVLSGGQLSVRMQSDSADFNATSTATITPGTWHHVAVTFGPSGLRIYLDGTEVATDSYTGGLTGNSEPFVLGADQANSGDGVVNNLVSFFDGQIDEFAFASTAYSATEIAQIAADGYDTTLNTGDYLDGGAGDDTLTGGEGGDTLFAGDGTDTLFGGAGDDTLDAGAGNDVIDNGAGNDTVYGGAGDDMILGGAGDDILDGGTGNDTFSDTTDTGTDTIIGGENAGDLDTIDFSGATGGTGVQVTFTSDEAGSYSIGAGSNGTFAEIEAILGTDFDDTFDATANTSGVSFDGGLGNDTILGGDGSDTIVGGTGDDTVTLGGGDDTVDTGQGTDRLILGDNAGNNTIFGGTGSTSTGDTLDGSSMTEDTTLVMTARGQGTLSSSGGTTTFDQTENFLTGSGNDSLTGSNFSDSFNAGDGDDTIDGGERNDQLAGGAGNDTFVAYETSGADSLFGGSGTDTISLATTTTGSSATVTYTSDGSGSFTLNNSAAQGTFSSIESIVGTGEGDTLDAGADSLGVTLDGAAGNDVLTGGAGDDTLIGGTGGDTLTGGSGNDLLIGGDGDDSLTGGDGDDTFRIETGIGSDTIAGGNGGETTGDTLDLSGVTANLTIDLSQNTTGNDSGTITDGANTMSFTGIENIVLGTGAETIILEGVHDDSLIGFEAPTDDGNGGFTAKDLLDVSAIAGADTDNTTITDDGNGNALLTFVNGATLQLIGIDPLSINSAQALNAMGIPLGATASDGTILGTSGDDIIDVAYLGDPDGDLVDNDDATLAGDTGNDDLIFAGDGNDTIDAGEGNDEVYGGAGNDTIVIGLGNETAFGGAGDDTFAIEDGTFLYTLSGGTGTDTLNFSGPFAASSVTVSIADGTGEFNLGSGAFTGIEQIIGTDGNDTLNATGDTLGVTILGGAGLDQILGGSGGDSLSGGDAHDEIVAGAGNDTLDGGAGNDALLDGAGNDTAYGGIGNDTFEPGSGDDSLFGGDGDDDFFLYDGMASGLKTIFGGTGGESGTGDLLSSRMAEDTTVTFTGVGSGTLSNTSTTVTFSEIEFISLGDGNDTLFGSSGADSVFGSDGNDTINLFGGADSVFGGTGNDIIDGGAGADSIVGGSGDDRLSGGTGSDYLSGSAGNDFIEASQGDSVQGGTGDDFIRLVDLNESATDTINIDGGGDATEGDTLDVGGLIDLQTVLDAATDNGSGSFSGSVVLNDGTTLNFADIENIICFTTGTRIATPQGLRAIETLVPGDLVVTRDHGLQPIRWIGQRTVAAEGKLAPIRLRPGVMAGLETDLLVSPQHRMLFQGYRAELLFGESEVLVPAKHLIDGHAVTQDEGGDVTYVHMMFDEHEIVFAEGAATESFHPGAVAMDTITDAAREELFEIFPELRTLPESYGSTARRCLLRHEAQLLRV